MAHHDELARSWELARTGQPLPAIEGLECAREVSLILRIREARVCGPPSLRLTFSDGTTKQVDVGPLLEGPIFEPLRDPAYDPGEEDAHVGQALSLTGQRPSG